MRLRPRSSDIRARCLSARTPAVQMSSTPRAMRNVPHLLSSLWRAQMRSASSSTSYMVALATCLGGPPQASAPSRHCTCVCRQLALAAFCVLPAPLSTSFRRAVLGEARFHRQMGHAGQISPLPHVVALKRPTRATKDDPRHVKELLREAVETRRSRFCSGQR